MKRCPTCNRTYADDGFTFCLEDGALLSASYEPNNAKSPTTIRRSGPPPTVALPPESDPTILPLSSAKEEQQVSLTPTIAVPTPKPSAANRFAAPPLDLSAPPRKKPIRRYLAISLLVLIGVVVAIYLYKNERSLDYNAGGVSVDLPRDLKNVETDQNIGKASVVIVSLTRAGQLFVGKERTPIAKDKLRFKLGELLQQQTEGDKIVYLAASGLNDYGTIIEVCDAIEKQEVFRVGLLVNSGSDVPSQLTVNLPSPRDSPTAKELIRTLDEVERNDDSNLKPNPLSLVVSISADHKVMLNMLQLGSVNDTAPLSEKLNQVFQARKEHHAYRPAFELRTDLPDDERIEKTVGVKADRSVKYGDVIKVIDAIKGAGARPIVLRTRDLSR